jgi:ectoine hydroxylase-related dioxygenase (phytanoyl-CoA dioxygenase family)
MSDGGLERHRLNRGFHWTAPQGPSRRITAEQAKAWDEHGFIRIDDAFDADEVQRVAAEIDPFEREAEDFLRTQKDGRFFIAQADSIIFCVHLVIRSDFLRRFCAGPVFQELAHDLVGPTVRLYWDQAVYKKPYAHREFPWHQDNGYTYVEPQSYLTCWVALTDATVENGCPWVIPGLHRHGTLAHRMTDFGFACFDDPPGAVPVPVRAGGIVVFSSLTPHRTGPNTTSGVRKTYIVQLAPDGAKVIEEDRAGKRTETPVGRADRQYPILVDRAPASPPPMARTKREESRWHP